jgi:von Willebrand factor type A domain-containing protein
VKNAALSVLDFYEPNDQWIGMVALPYGQGSPGSLGSTGKCEVYGDRRTAAQCNPTPPPTYQLYPTTAGSTLWWNTAALSKDYKNATGINPASNLVQEINCLQRARNFQGSNGDRVYARSQGGSPTGSHTNLGDSLDAARAMLATGRPDVPDVIIFMTDGQANQPSTMLPCAYFNNKANLAKNAGQVIFTIAYGLDNTRCVGDTSGTYYNQFATRNMTDAATQPTYDQWPGTCNPLENKDNDWYFCAPATADLEPVFRQVAAAAIDAAHLVD